MPKFLIYDHSYYVFGWYKHNAKIVEEPRTSHAIRVNGKNFWCY
jgi:hypothetical protein